MTRVEKESFLNSLRPMIIEYYRWVYDMYSGLDAGEIKERHRSVRKVCDALGLLESLYRMENEIDHRIMLSLYKDDDEDPPFSVHTLS